MSYYKGVGNKYEQVPDLVVDFHGYTTLECSHALDGIISEGNHRHIRLIVGKGRNSVDGPVLPNFVKQYLRARNIRFNPSKIADGGEGSLEVFF